jgi:hypothetical protein
MKINKTFLKHFILQIVIMCTLPTIIVISAITGQITPKQPFFNIAFSSLFILFIGLSYWVARSKTKGIR